MEGPESEPPLEVPWQDADGRFVDLRENPAAVREIEPGRHMPLGRFLAAVNSADSVFNSVKCKARAGEGGADAGAEEAHGFSSEVALVYAQEGLNGKRANYEGLAQQLVELLSRDAPADALSAELNVRPCRFGEQRHEGYCLRIVLQARGSTAEQAEVRWGLGLARVQQALLYLSRVIRHQTAGD